MMIAIFASNVRSSIELDELIGPIGLLVLAFMVSFILSFWVKHRWAKLICFAYLLPIGIVMFRELLYSFKLIKLSADDSLEHYLMLASPIIWVLGSAFMIFSGQITKKEWPGMIGISLLTGGGLLLFVLGYNPDDRLFGIWLLVVIPVVFLLLRIRHQLAIWCMAILPLSYWLIAAWLVWLSPIH